VTVDCAQIDRPARAAARTEHIEPGRSSDQRSPARRRPQHVPAGRQAPIPTVDDELCLQTCCAVGLQLRCAGFDVEASCPNTHRASIRARAREVDLAYVPAESLIPDLAAPPVLAGRS
jgi:hypothetical protein